MNGAIVNSFLATAWTFLPKKNPVRAQAALLSKILKRPVSNFDGDASAALWAYKAAIERGSASRAGINNASNFEAPRTRHAGRQDLLSQANHTGLQLDSMWVGKIQIAR